MHIKLNTWREKHIHYNIYTYLRIYLCIYLPIKWSVYSSVHVFVCLVGLCFPNSIYDPVLSMSRLLMKLSVYLNLYLSWYTNIRLYIAVIYRLSTDIHVIWWVYKWSIYAIMSVSIYISMYLSIYVYLSIYLAVAYLYVNLCICVSIYMYLTAAHLNPASS